MRRRVRKSFQVSVGGCAAVVVVEEVDVEEVDVDVEVEAWRCDSAGDVQAAGICCASSVEDGRVEGMARVSIRLLVL